MTILAYIPSPAHSTIDIGPLTVHIYGLMLLASIAGAMWLFGVRYVRRGGNWDLVFQITVWGVLAGVVGARLYHDLTSWNEVQQIHHWWAPFAVWKGGLGIYGGLLFGVLAGAIVIHRAGESLPKMLDLVAPGLLFAQAIGRWGNYFNQELFGKPTKLPWGLKIDLVNRPRGYERFSTFQPTFLYEFLLALLGIGFLLLLERRYRFRSPALFALYVAYYSLFRFFIELLRIDPAHHFAGLRLNAWVSIFLFVISWGFFVWWQFIRRDSAPAEGPGQSPPDQPKDESKPRRGKRAKKPSVKVKGPRMTVPKGRVRSGR
jgi:prolipoprotein diacylglyceryl transferase